MFAKLPFRTKLVLVVSVPLFVLVGFAGMGIASRFVDLSTQEQYGDLLGPFARLTAVSRAVGDEAVASAWYSGAPVGDKAAQKLLTDSRKVTDSTIQALRDSRPAIDDHASEGTRLAARRLLQSVDNLTRARQQVDARADAGQPFITMSRDALDVASAVASDVTDRELSTSLVGIVDLRRSQLAASHEADLVESYLLTGAQTDVLSWVDSITEQDSEIAKFMSTATTAERTAFAQGSAAAPDDPVRDAATSDPTAFPSVSVTPAEYADAYLAKQAETGKGLDNVQHVVDTTADQKVSDARSSALLFAVFTAAIIGLVLALALALVRSLNRPLRALTRAARDVSERRLPQLVDTLQHGGELAPGQLEELSPIRIESPDEFGALAKAFNTIQHVTVAVAEQQSKLLRKGIGDLYVNLARRNQSLLDRQISLLDDMEAREQRSDELGSLFELDQLSTRMRRNAESLLVLAGVEQPRQLRTAVSVLDVVRGAAAEIADFVRVTYFGFDDDASVAGNAVADVTHLLAELLENATSFSPPETPVVVSGQALERRFLVTITDEGIGMEDDRLMEANQLVARPPAVGLALSRTLGLHVVGHLAARHGIQVQLRRVPSAGISAIVALPDTIMTARDETFAPEPTPPMRSAPPVAHAAPMPAEPVPAEPVPAEPGSAEPVSARGPAPDHPTSGHGEITWRPAGTSMVRARRSPQPPVDSPATAANDHLTHRVQAHDVPTSGSGNGAGAPPHGNGLAARVPGANLTHQPREEAPPAASGVRPRPERVQEMLTRHQRGIREGRDRDGDE